MYQTRRICIDSRLAEESPAHGIQAQELIDQLVASQGEPRNIGGEWMRRRRTVLMTHPKQLFSGGDLKRFNTRRKIGTSPLYRLWESHFVKTAGITGFHRFRTVDHVVPRKEIAALTTLLPGKDLTKLSKLNDARSRYVVPSVADKGRLIEAGVKNVITVIKPGVRRFVHHTPLLKTPRTERALVLVFGSTKEERKFADAASLIESFHPNLEVTRINLEKAKTEVAPGSWGRLMHEAALVGYLTEAPFDWGTLALESIYLGIPTVFADQHSALSERLLPNSLQLSNYLQTGRFSELKTNTLFAKSHLEKQNIFFPLELARQYGEAYEILS